MSKLDAVIFDVDGVLLDSQHRNRHIHPVTNWHKYYSNEEMDKDEPISANIVLLHELRKTHEVFLSTARPEALRVSTTIRLRQVGVFVRNSDSDLGIRMFMRHPDDEWGLAKERAVTEIRKMSYHINLAFDDSYVQCEFFRSVGIHAVQIASDIHSGPHVDDSEYIKELYRA